MSITTIGIVTKGVIIPDSPLPEGAQVEIHVREALAEIPQELREELAAWQQGSAEALALVERSAADEVNEKR
jgi:hypothetical protein